MTHGGPPPIVRDVACKSIIFEGSCSIGAEKRASVMEAWVRKDQRIESGLRATTSLIFRKAQTRSGDHSFGSLVGNLKRNVAKTLQKDDKKKITSTKPKQSDRTFSETGRYEE